MSTKELDPLLLTCNIEFNFEKESKKYSTITIAKKKPYEKSTHSASIYLQYKGSLPKTLLVSYVT